MNCNYKVKMKDIQNKYKFKIFCAGYEYDDTEIKQDITDLQSAVSQKANITESGRYIDLELNTSTYVLTAKLKDKNNNLISTSTQIDLPLETMIVDAEYDSTNKAIILTLQNGNTLSVPIGDIISGLVTEDDLEKVVDELDETKEELERYKTIYNALAKVKDEGTNLTLNDTAESILKLDLKGNTYQYSTSGKNLLDINSMISTTGMSYTVNGNVATMTGTGVWSRMQKTITFPANKNYTLMGYVDGESGARAGLLVSNQSQTYQEYSINDSGNRTFIYVNFNTNSATELIIQLYGNWSGTSKTTTTTFEKIMVVEGTYTTEQEYEAFTGSTPTQLSPSPNPDYPQDIQVVSGDNTIEVVGKNLLKLNAKYTISGITFEPLENGKLSITGTSTANIYFNFATAKLEANTSYNLNVSEISSGFVPYLNSSVSSGGNWVNIQTKNTTFQVGESKTYNVAYNITSGKTLNTVVEVQLELGSTATTYEPYQSQTYPINLGDIELCKIGDYQDYIYKDSGKWYKYGAIGKVVLDGSESYDVEQSGEFYRFNLITNDMYNYNGRGTYAISSHFHSQTDNGYGAIITYQNRIMLYPNDTSITTSDQFKTWLSTHNTIVYYVLATPTYEEITDNTLVGQLNTLESAYSYNEQTNISQENDDLEFIISASALYDLSNLVTRVAVLETE